MFIRTFADITFDELVLDAEDAAEHLGEIEAQDYDERSMYGDSWPGAQLQIDRQRELVNAMQAELDRRLARFQVLLPGVNSVTFDTDIPF